MIKGKIYYKQLALNGLNSSSMKNAVNLISQRIKEKNGKVRLHSKYSTLCSPFGQQILTCTFSYEADTSQNLMLPIFYVSITNKIMGYDVFYPT